MTIAHLPNQVELLKWLQNLGSGFAPVSVRVVGQGSKRSVGNRPAPTDTLVEVRWKKQRFRFLATLCPLSTPKSIQAAVDKLAIESRERQLYPLVVTPYLSEESLNRLEEQAVSGLDLCGNGLLQIPGKLLVRRSGASNKYPRGTVIQNVYRGTSSLVARAFLLRPYYETVQDLLTELQSRGAAVTLSTISKVCSALAEDLIVLRERKDRRTQLSLLQPDKLLAALASQFETASPQRQFIGKCSLQDKQRLCALQAWQEKQRERIVRTGADSTGQYATMAREPTARYYCTNLASLIHFLGPALSETSRFPDIEILETSDPTVYYDTRQDFMASPIQCYLELQAGDPREQQTAEQVRRFILEKAGSGSTRR